MPAQEKAKPADAEPKTETVAQPNIQPNTEETETTSTKTFSQEELNQILKERLQRERQKFADYDDLKDKAKNWQAYEEAQKSEIQKAQEKATANEAKYKALQERLREEQINNQIIKAAAKIQLDGDLAVKLVDKSGLTVTEAGVVEDIDKVLKGVLDKWPQLKGGGPAPTTDAQKGGGGQPRTAKMTDDEVKEWASKFQIRDMEAAKAELRRQGRY